MKVKPGLSFFSKILLFVNCLLAFALLISYLAPFTDPQKIWLIAFFGLAYPPLLLVNIIFFLIWIFKKSLYALISLTCILIGIQVLQNSIGFHAARTYNQKEPAIATRVMTYNVHSFKRYGAANDIWTKHEILDIIKEKNPDIIGFQEFYTRFKGEYAMRDSIKQLLNAGYYLEPFEYMNKNDALGMAIFSKYPIIDHGIIRLSDNRNVNQCVYVDVKTNTNQVIRFYSIHLKSIGFDHEDYQYLDSVSSKGKTDIHSFRRICSKLKQAFIKRSMQVQLIKEHTAKCPYPYVISGDFNDTPSSYAVNQLSKGLKNAFREKGSGLGRTYNGDFPNYQIDYILASPRFNISDYRVVEKKLSDHYPVYSDLVLK